MALSFCHTPINPQECRRNRYNSNLTASYFWVAGRTFGEFDPMDARPGAIFSHEVSPAWSHWLMTLKANQNRTLVRWTVPWKRALFSRRSEVAGQPR